jgi:hypothetical protein
VRALLALALAACTQVDKTVIPAQPPADVTGTYAVLWKSESGSELSGGAALADAVVTFEPYPCASLVGQQALGGGFAYDHGAFSAELKSIDGQLKLTVAGDFAPDGGMAGEYEARFLGVVCDRGKVAMR